MQLKHHKLVALMQKAYSAEKAAAFAYIGHAASLKNTIHKAAVKTIEKDEWNHRKEVLAIMRQYNVSPSRWLEVKYYIIGKSIALSCFIIGWFMPVYFAGRLESGNVCEYFKMMHYFHESGIYIHDEILYEMGMKEKEHEIFFINMLQDSKLLPLFEKLFSWGNKSFNDVDLEKKYSVEQADAYCRK